MVWPDKIEFLHRAQRNSWLQVALSDDPAMLGLVAEITGHVFGLFHRKWREDKQQLSGRSDPALLGCCLISLHFLCCIRTRLPNPHVKSWEISVHKWVLSHLSRPTTRNNRTNISKPSACLGSLILTSHAACLRNTLLEFFSISFATSCLLALYNVCSTSSSQMFGYTKMRQLFSADFLHEIPPQVSVWECMVILWLSIRALFQWKETDANTEESYDGISFVRASWSKFWKESDYVVK